MKKAIVHGFFAAAAIVLFFSVQGCGEPCTSDPAPVSAIGSCSGAVPAGGEVTIQVRVCPTSCATTICGSEFVNGQIEIFPSFQECSSCEAGCSVQPASCSFTAPSTPGPYRIAYPTASGRESMER